MNSRTSDVRGLANAGIRSLSRFTCIFALALAFASSVNVMAQSDAANSIQAEDAFILQPEDQLRITFPGAPELDVALQVRRDGVISVPIIGEVMAEGKTPSELEAHLTAAFENQLVSNEVMVSVVESHFTYYLEGEVRSPGIIQSFRQLSVLEAIIAAGGINKTTGKLNSVIVLRRDGNKYKRFDLDLKAILDGKTDEAFVLQSYDVVSIPQRIW